MKRNIFIILILILLAGCSTLKEMSYQDKENLVRHNLAYLNNFKGEGVLEVSFKGLSLKKEFLIIKNHNSLRLDVLDSGIFSLIPSPFASLYVKDSAIITNYNKGLFPDMVFDKIPLQELLDFSKLPQGIIDEIIKNKAFTIAIIQFEFDDFYRLSKIKVNQESLNLIYRGPDLSRIELASQKADVNIDFDLFQQGEFEIKPIILQKNN
jgi:hypothetical protein